jgi:hypothetical protein
VQKVFKKLGDTETHMFVQKETTQTSKMFPPPLAGALAREDRERIGYEVKIS